MNKSKKRVYEIRRKLKALGVVPPKWVSVFHAHGDTFHIVDLDDGWMTTATAAIRHSGYYATLLKTDGTEVGILVFNLAGTEWQDGLIPENLAGLPLRHPDDVQLLLFAEGG